jgi:uncharacterized membrane protein YraQ (UPF0718 family)
MNKFLSYILPVIFIALVMLGVYGLTEADQGIIFLEEPDAEVWTFHTWAGLVLFVFLMVASIITYFRRFKKGREALDRITSLHKIPDKVKWWVMVALLPAAAYLFIYCNYICTNFNQQTFDSAYPFFHILYRYALGFFPYLVAACFIGGFIMTYYNSSRFKMPDSMPGAMLFASFLPICSCGAIPIGRAMMETGKIRVRTIIAFMMVAPVLSPIVIPLSFQLGLEFVVTRIVGIAVLASVTGILVEKFTGVKEEGKGGKAYSCVGCPKAGKIKPATTKSPVIASWNLLLTLAPPISQGILMGSLVAKYVPPEAIAPFLTSNALSIFIIGLLALPLYICHGQEVLILKPLMSASMMGEAVLPVGHAIAFTFTGTGMCLAAIPPLMATIGKKATIFVISAFYFGSIAIGLIASLIFSII